MIEVILQGESVMDFEKVKEIIVETLSCDADKVTPDARLAEDLEADSLVVQADGTYVPDPDVPVIPVPAKKKWIFAVTSRLFQLFRYLI